MSEGLEGRSKNPVSLLFDTLVHPNTDTGEFHPSSLSWTHQPQHAVSHVVVGRGEPGGSWHQMNPSVHSLSPGKWLQLPIYGFKDWLNENQEGEDEEEEEEDEEEGRIKLGNVAKYYEAYVKKMGLEAHFRNNVTVTQTRLLYGKSKKDCRSQSCESTFSSVSSDSSEGQNLDTVSPDHDQVFTSPCHSMETTSGGVPGRGETEQVGDDECSDVETEVGLATCDSDDTGISCCNKRLSLSSEKCRWVVRGRTIDKDGQETCLCVCAKNLVLATGVNDSPRKLGVPGEDQSFVRHSISEALPTDRGGRPVMVVGAGLAAADVVIHTLSKGGRVVHVFHQDATDQRLVYNTMDPSIYPEYIDLYQRMCGRVQDAQYTPLPLHRVQSFAEGGVCTLHNLRDGRTSVVEVSQALVLIGGQAQLDFLPECITRQLGLKTGQPIDTKRNPMDLDPYTFESEHFPSLFALGPLSGDNFVRFVLGGAVGITKRLHEKDL